MHPEHGSTKFFAFPLVLIGLVVLSSAGEVGAVAQPCQVQQVSPVYPQFVSPGQQIEVQTTIAVTCAQWRTYYSGRVDLLDRVANHVLSTNGFDIGWRQNVTATVSNNATAPESPGPWGLKLVVYIFDDMGVVNSTVRFLDIQVTPTISTVTQYTSEVIETSSITQTSTTTLPVAIVTQTVFKTQTIVPVWRTVQSYGWFVIVAVLVAVLLAFLLLRMRKRNA